MSPAISVELEKPMRFTDKQLKLRRSEVVKLAVRLSLSAGVYATASDHGRVLVVNIVCNSQRSFDRTKIDVEDTIRAIIASSSKPALRNDEAAMLVMEASIAQHSS
jgi:hypothetical protein